MKVLIACEESQTVCKAFRKKGHEAYSCDILPCSGGHPEWHLQMDMFEAIKLKQWDLMIAHPVCTYLTCSAEWAYKDPDFVRYPNVGYHQKLKEGTLFGEARRQAREEALQTVCKLLNAPIKKKVIENPVGVISSRIFWYIGGESGPAEWKVFPRKTIGCIKPHVIQPHWFGDDASKATALYYVNVDKIKATNHVLPRIVNGKKRWANQTDSGQNNLPPSKDRAKLRSKTLPGIADALADQIL